MLITRILGAMLWGALVGIFVALANTKEWGLAAYMFSTLLFIQLDEIKAKK